MFFSCTINCQKSWLFGHYILFLYKIIPIWLSCFAVMRCLMFCCFKLTILTRFVDENVTHPPCLHSLSVVAISFFMFNFLGSLVPCGISEHIFHQVTWCLVSSLLNLLIFSFWRIIFLSLTVVFKYNVREERSIDLALVFWVTKNWRKRNQNLLLLFFFFLILIFYQIS